jgi:hypothetical protein
MCHFVVKCYERRTKEGNPYLEIRSGFFLSRPPEVKFQLVAAIAAIQERWPDFAGTLVFH